MSDWKAEETMARVRVGPSLLKRMMWALKYVQLNLQPEHPAPPPWLQRCPEEGLSEGKWLDLKHDIAVFTKYGLSTERVPFSTVQGVVLSSWYDWGLGRTSPSPKQRVLLTTLPSTEQVIALQKLAREQIETFRNGKIQTYEINPFRTTLAPTMLPPLGSKARGGFIGGLKEGKRKWVLAGAVLFESANNPMDVFAWRFLRLLGNVGHLIQSCAECERLFMPPRTDQIYCDYDRTFTEKSKSCRSRANQRSYRNNHPKPPKKRGRPRKRRRRP